MMRHPRPLAAIALLLSAAPAFAAPRDILFYNDINCAPKRQNWTSVDSTARTILNCTYKDTCPNDEIKSVRIAGTVKKGTGIKLCDDSTCTDKDDWANITVLALPSGGICVRSLERTYEGKDFLIFYHRVSNLNGKVSRIEISPPRK